MIRPTAHERVSGRLFVAFLVFVLLGIRSTIHPLYATADDGQHRDPKDLAGVLLDRSNDKQLRLKAGAALRQERNFLVSQNLVSLVKVTTEEHDLDVKRSLIECLRVAEGHGAEAILSAAKSAPAAERLAYVELLDQLANSIEFVFGEAKDDVRDFFMTACTDEESRSRAAAARGLARWNDSVSVRNVLTRLSRDAEWSVRAGAIYALGNRETESPEVFRSLLEATRDESPEVRAEAVRGFWQFGSKSRQVHDVIEMAMTDSHAVVRSNALSLLGSVGDALVQHYSVEKLFGFLQAGLTDSDSDVRVSAAYAASDSHWEPLANKLLPLLMPCAREGSDELRTAALGALGSHINTSSEAMAVVREATGATSPEVRRQALVELGHANLLDEATLSCILQAQKDSHVEVRSAAMYALERCADHGVRKLDLGRISNAWIEFAKDPSPEIQSKALSTMSHYVPEPLRQDVLEKALKNSDAWVRGTAIEEFCKTRSTSKVRQAIEAAIQDPNVHVRQVAARGLRNLPDAAALPILEVALKDLDLKVRSRALSRAGHIERTSEALLAGIRACLSEPVLAGEAAEALGRIGAAAKPAIEQLHTLAKGDVEFSRRKAVWALGQIDPQALADVPNADAIAQAEDRLIRSELQSSFRITVFRAEDPEALGDYRFVISMWEKAARLAEQGYGTVAEPAALCWLRAAKLHVRILEFEKAETLLSKASQHWEKLGVDGRVVRCESELLLAEIRIIQSRLDEAESVLKMVEVLFTDVSRRDRPELDLRAADLRAVIAISRGEIEAAVAILIAALERKGSTEARPRLQSRLGNLLLRLGNVNSAEVELTDAISHRELSDDLRAGALMSLAAIDAHKQQFPSAKKRATEARRIARGQLASLLPSTGEHERLTCLMDFEGDSLAQTMAIAARLTEDNAEEAATWVLNAKSLIGEETAEINTQLQDSVNEYMKTRFQEFNTIKSRIAMQAFRSDKTSDLTALQERESELSAELSEFGRQPGHIERWVTCSDVRSRLPEGHVLVEIGVCPPLFDRSAPAQYMAWIIPPKDAGSVTAVSLGALDEVNAAVSAVHDTMRSNTIQPAEIRSRLDRLATLILRPLESRLNAFPTWIVSPDSALGHVPWSALRLSGGSYVCERHAVSLLPSGRFLTFPFQASGRSHGVCIVGDPSFDNAAVGDNSKVNFAVRSKRWERLTGSRQEVESLVSVFSQFGMHPVERFVEDRATEAAVKSLHRPQILFVSTHAFAANHLGMEDQTTRESQSGARSADVRESLCQSGIVLSGANLLNDSTVLEEDGLLTGLEVIGLDLQGTELVVLSACDSGATSIRQFETLDGLRFAFHLAGATNVVTSLWKVSDAQASEFMKRFAQHLTSGQDVAHALRLAQIETIHNSSGDSDCPYYWASWTISGRPQGITGFPASIPRTMSEGIGRETDGEVDARPAKLLARSLIVPVLLFVLGSAWLWRRKKGLRSN
mgnify:CR=1 FL=1